MKPHNDPQPCRVCGEPVLWRSGLSNRVHSACRTRKQIKPERTPAPAYKLTRAAKSGATRPSVDIGKGNHRDRGPSKSKSAAECRWMDRVAALACVVCGVAPVELHHIREGEGAAMRAQHTLVLPFCPEHHRGASGLHGLGKRGFYARYKRDELDLLAETIERLA